MYFPSYIPQTIFKNTSRGTKRIRDIEVFEFSSYRDLTVYCKLSVLCFKMYNFQDMIATLYDYIPSYWYMEILNFDKYMNIFL